MKKDEEACQKKCVFAASMKGYYGKVKRKNKRDDLYGMSAGGCEGEKSMISGTERDLEGVISLFSHLPL